MSASLSEMRERLDPCATGNARLAQVRIVLPKRGLPLLLALLGVAGMIMSAAEPDPKGAEEVPPQASSLLAEEIEAATQREAPGEEDEPAALAPVFYCNSSDPFVMLDEAKIQIGEGKVRRAAAMLEVIEADPADPYATEELQIQRLLLAGALLNAAGAVLKDAEAANYSDSKYSSWLRGEVERYAAGYSRLGQAYLNSLADGQDCDFIRFRLPRVTADHLSDAVLYSDPQVLRAAVQNWDEGKTGLGKGLIGTQARVALVLGAAAFYDLTQSAATIEGVSARLQNGVPLDKAVLLDWLAQTAADQADTAGQPLRSFQRAVDAQLGGLLQPGSLLRQRYDKRNGQPESDGDQADKTQGSSNSKGH